MFNEAQIDSLISVTGRCQTILKTWSHDWIPVYMKYLGTYV